LFVAAFGWLLTAVGANAAQQAGGHPLSVEEIKKAEAERLDINVATLEQLKQVPGIDADIAAKIIASRPYARRSDLVEKNVLPKALYLQIRNAITVRSLGGWRVLKP
jgi:DNA uptake protein ComE-like DNA-binding protein